MLEYLRHRSTPPTDLLGIIAYVRGRWRMKLAVRGAVTILFIALAVFFVAASGLQWARFSVPSIIAARVLLGLALAASGFWFLVRPMRRKVTDEQVALYLEEHEPALQTTLVSAVEASKAGRDWESTALVRRLVEQAIERCMEMDAARRVERLPIRRYGAALATVAVVAVLTVAFGPAFLRSALSAVLLISRSVEAAAPYRIEVTPGSVDVPKGADQTITAKLIGFDAADAVLMVRRNPTAAFEALPLVRSEGGDYEGLLFDLSAPLDYFVQAEGVQSQTYTLKVVDVPYAQRIELEYIFPAYTGLEPQKIEDGGDIAVLKGTEIRMRVFPTMKTPGGSVQVNDTQSVALGFPDADGALAASFKADKAGFYHVELTAPSGEKRVASPKYTIDILTDQPPSVSFARPGRDSSASPIEEVFIEAQAEDDFGVRDLELVYSVNGGPEKTVKLFGGTGRRLAEVTAGHTIYMEELGVQSGDAVSYYARALDNSGSGQPTTSDLYFLRVRPFKQDFRQAMSQGGGGGGGGGAQQQVDALSEQQRQIIAATFNIQRDRKSMTAQKLRESSTVVGLSQSRLREQVEGMLTRMNSQLVQQDPAFAKIAEMMPKALEAMKEAEAQLAKTAPDQALPAENRALQVLQKAEEEYQMQVSAQQGGGGGGGGGSQQQQELADIFEQELDKMASRYETANRSQQENADRQVDELLEKLKELARRQQQEAERQRRRSLEQGGQQGGGGGGQGGSSAAQQRALAEQAEEAARRLERLSREENRQDLADAARQMREAADAMRRAAAGGDGQASAQAQRALERLQETERRLQRGLSDRADRDIQDAQQLADDVARQQQEIANGVRNLGNAAGQRRADAARRINEQKDELEAKLGQLEAQLDSAAREASSQERAASRKLADAAGEIRNNRLRDKIRYSKALVSRGFSPDSLQANESDISSGIEEMRERLGEAQTALGQAGEGDQRAEAVDRARRLARGLESIEERTRERAEQQARGQQGRQMSGEGEAGRQGQQGQQGGRDGQQAGQAGEAGQQAGQSGQRGGQGQQGQGQGQGQQGQMGQGGQGGQAGGVNNGFGGGQFNGGGAGFTGRAWNGRLTPEDIRQLQAEMRQWSGEAQALRGQLRGTNIDPRELDELMRAFRQLEDSRVYQDVAELQRLQSFVTEGIKRFEFNLRRQVDATENSPALTGSDQVPEEFRKLVEQYYRSLSRGSR